MTTLSAGLWPHTNGKLKPTRLHCLHTPHAAQSVCGGGGVGPAGQRTRQTSTPQQLPHSALRPCAPPARASASQSRSSGEF